MRKYLLVSVPALFLLGGCAAPSQQTTWHSQIAPVPTTQPAGSTDPVTGEHVKDFADQPFPQPLTRESAFVILLNTDTFAESPGQAEAGPTAQVHAFSVLLTQHDAVDVFDDLLHRAHPAGKLFALCGLRLLAPAKYSAAESALLQDKTPVTCSNGCIVDQTPMKDIILANGRNVVRLAPGETLEAWWTRPEHAGGATFDIHGGGWPAEFQQEH